MCGDGVKQTAPVLFIGFARPDLTKRVLRAIEAAQPQRLYVSLDAARDDVDEQGRADEVAALIDAIDWQCEVFTNRNPVNLGPGAGPRAAVNWFFSQEESGIILEDDCLPNTSFFSLCTELLERYRDTPEVMAISGTSFAADAVPFSASYAFSRYVTMWGWASWRRAWDQYVWDLPTWPSRRGTDWLSRVGDGHQDFAEHWSGVFDMVTADLNEYWDYQFQYAIWENDGLVIHPAQNLISNIGFTDHASHTRRDDVGLGARPTSAMPPVLTHPVDLTRNPNMDRWIDRNIYRTRRTIRGRVFRALMRNLQRLQS
jgi:hypothetical protein